MAGRFDIRKIGKTLGFLSKESKIERFQLAVSKANHLGMVVNTQDYQATLGNFLRNAEEADIRRLRRGGDNKNSREQLEGRLQILEEINNYINTTITNGQKALVKLEEEENARRKHAS